MHEQTAEDSQANKGCVQQHSGVHRRWYRQGQEGSRETGETTDSGIGITKSASKEMTMRDVRDDSRVRVSRESAAARKRSREDGGALRLRVASAAGNQHPHTLITIEVVQVEFLDFILGIGNRHNADPMLNHQIGKLVAINQHDFLFDALDVLLCTSGEL